MPSTLSEKINRLHNLYHPYNPVGVYHEVDNPNGCREEFCVTELPPLVTASDESGTFITLRTIFKVSSHNFRVAHVSQSKLQAIRSLMQEGGVNIPKSDIQEILDI